MVGEMQTVLWKAWRNDALMELCCVSQRITTPTEWLLHSDLQLAPATPVLHHWPRPLGVCIWRKVHVGDDLLICRQETHVHCLARCVVFSFTHPYVHLRFAEECLGRAVSSRKPTLPRDVRLESGIERRECFHYFSVDFLHGVSFVDLHVNVNLFLSENIGAPRLEQASPES